MKLAKPHLDLGLFTNDIAAQRGFWANEVGLRLDHELEMEPGWVQHRFDAHGSVIKVNHRRAALPDEVRSGYAALLIASDTPWEGTHPGGDRVSRVTPGEHGVVGVGVVVTSPEPDRMMEFYLGAMEFEAAGRRVARCGDSLLFVEKGPGGAPTSSFVAPNFRYLTIQIFDADEACDAVVRRGGRLGRAPVSFRDVARYGFVCDPDGNWIELSARASLTGVAPRPE